MSQMRSTTAVYAALVAFAGLVGIVVATLPWQLSALLVIVTLGAIALVVAKIGLRPVQAAARDDSRITEEDPHMRLPRVLYYVGAAAIGFLTIRPAIAFTASDWIFFLAFGVTCVVLLVYGVDRAFLVPPAITIGIALFAVGGIISSFESAAPFESVFIVVRLLYLTIVWFWLGTIVLQTRAHVEYAVLAWVGSAALSSGAAVVQYFYGDVVPGGDVAYGRMSGFTPHFNNLGGLAATAFVPALMLAVDSPRRPLRVLGFAALGLVSMGLLLAGSIGGMLAAIIATVFWLTVRGVTANTVVNLLAVAAVGVVVMSATGVTGTPDPLGRLERVTAPQDAGPGAGSIHTRLDGYKLAWERIREQPLIGIGLDEASAAEALEGGHLVHNILLNQWFSAGFLGLVGVTLLIGGALLTGFRTVRGSPRDQRPLTAALVASTVAFLLFAMGEPILFVRYGWFPVAMLVALRAQMLRAEAGSLAPGRRSARAPVGYPVRRARHAGT
jgi:O-antigen ligase